MTAGTDALYEKFLSLSHEEQSILKSAANDSIINSVKIARLYLDAEATQPVISAFLKQIKEQ